MKLYLKSRFSIKSYLDHDTFFFIAYIIYLFFLILKSSFFSQYLGLLNKLIYIGVAGILVVCELMRFNASKKSVILAFFTFLFSFVFLLRMNGRYELVPFFLLLYCGKNINFKRIARVTAIVCACTILIVIASSYIGIIPNYISKSYYGGSVRIRHYLGFRYALYPAGILFNAISMDLYAHHKHLTFKRCVLWLVFALFILWKTDSRLFSYFSILVIVGFYVLSVTSDAILRKRPVQLLMIGSFIICACFSIEMSLHYTRNNAFLRNLNDLLEQRLRLGKNAFDMYQIKPFGQKINFVGNGLASDGSKAVGLYNYVDNFYESSLLKYGYVFLFAFIVMATLSAILICKKKDYYLLCLLALFAVHAMIDDMVLYLSYNTLWFVLFSSLFPQRDTIHINSVFKTLFHSKKRKKLSGG